MCNKESTKFIVVEGIDGAGKDTKIESIISELKSQGIDKIKVLKFPSETVREKLLSGNDITNDEIKTLLQQDFINHKSIIEDYKSKGYYVIANRYVLSMFIYQYHGKIKELCGSNNLIINPWIIENIAIPDEIYLLHAPWKTIVETLKQRKTTDSIESNISTLEEYYDLYISIIMKAYKNGVDIKNGGKYHINIRGQHIILKVYTRD